MKLIHVLPFFAMLLTMAESPPRPFFLWTPEEAQAIRERLETDPEAQVQLEHTLSLSQEVRGRVILVDLFRATVLQEQDAAEREHNALLQSLGRKPEPLTWEVDPATLVWNEGMPSDGDSHMRDERTEDALRYDRFHEQLTPAQNEGIQTYFNSYIQFHLDGHPPRHPNFRYDRMSWLPNMHWPRPIGTHLLAIALGDEEQIRKMFHADGGWKWYFDEYLGDQGFYMEEFGKFYSNTGSMILWCEALERMGLGEMGYDYTSPSGISMRTHLRANTLDLAFPAIDWGGGMPTYPNLTMGDAKGSQLLREGAPVQHAMVMGYLPNGIGGNRRVSQHRMNGPMAKMHEPFWFEAAHRRWPEDGYDFFLAAMRAPDEEKYYPTLFFNLSPVDPQQVRAPAPTPSYLAKDRGFAMLRQDHSPAYWTGKRPAAALQFSRYYVHYVHDAMTLIGYHAFNAPLILNAWGTGRGYAGGDAWRDSVRGHSGVIVDNLRATPVAKQDDGTVGHRYRSNLENDLDIRFVAIRADNTYPGVAHERALVLAEHYLLDITWLRNDDPDTPRRFEWQALTPLSQTTTEGWTETPELSGMALYEGSPFENRVRNDPPAPTNTRVLEAGDTAWNLRLAYAQRAEIKEEDHVHGGFVRRGVGMDLHMLGTPGTRVFTAIPPGAPSKAPPTLVLARRETSATTFTAVYAPFENQQPVVTGVEQIAKSEDALAIRIHGTLPEGAPFADLILMSLGDHHEQERTLHGAHGFHARFIDHAVVRLSDPSTPIVTGNLISLSLP